MEGKKSSTNITTDSIVDRISDLPDSILGHILSFLTTTDEAVATSVLSKRWKFVWVTILNLYFCNLMKRTDEEYMEFVRFVNRVLLLNDAGWLNKFTLTCQPWSISPPQIISWINTAITRNVHELILTVGDVDMPTSLFSCESLRSLVLHDLTCIDAATAVCLPRLERLRFDLVRFESEEACEKLISGCPILQYLKLGIEDKSGDADDDFMCIISSASLRRLELGIGPRRKKLKLKASSLEYLGLVGCISEIFVEKNSSSVVESDFNIFDMRHGILGNSIVEAVRAFDCVKFLTLSADVTRALSRSTSSLSLSTEFKRLMKLEASFYCSCSLQDFIQNSKNLEDLTVYQRDIRPRYINVHDHSRWTTLEEVPRCLSTSLKKIHFYGCNGSEDGREMIHYMLKYGSVLEVIEVL